MTDEAAGDLSMTKIKRAPYANTRKLIHWDNDKEQFLLLAIIHECDKQGVELPLLAAIRHLCKDSSAEAARQHFTKLRKARVDQGKPVPPRLGRNGKKIAGGEEDTEVVTGTHDYMTIKGNKGLTNKSSPEISTKPPKPLVSFDRGNARGVTKRKANTDIAPISKKQDRSKKIKLEDNDDPSDQIDLSRANGDDEYVPSAQAGTKRGSNNNLKVGYDDEKNRSKRSGISYAEDDLAGVGSEWDETEEYADDEDQPIVKLSDDDDESGRVRKPLSFTLSKEKLRQIGSRTSVPASELQQSSGFSPAITVKCEPQLLEEDTTLPNNALDDFVPSDLAAYGLDTSYLNTSFVPDLSSGHSGFAYDSSTSFNWQRGRTDTPFMQSGTNSVGISPTHVRQDYSTPTNTSSFSNQSCNMQPSHNAPQGSAFQATTPSRNINQGQLPQLITPTYSTNINYTHDSIPYDNPYDTLSTIGTASNTFMGDQALDLAATMPPPSRSLGHNSNIFSNGAGHQATAYGHSVSTYAQPRQQTYDFNTGSQFPYNNGFTPLGQALPDPPITPTSMVKPSESVSRTMSNTSFASMDQFGAEVFSAAYDSQATEFDSQAVAGAQDFGLSSADLWGPSGANFDMSAGWMNDDM